MVAVSKLSFVLGSVLAPAAQAFTPQSFASSLDNTYQLSPYTAPVSGKGNTTLSSTWGIKVTDTAAGHKQTIDGFGAAVTDSTVSTFNTLGAKKKAALMTALFDPVNGIGFNLMRHTIGASDLSSVPYSYDNQTAPDPQLKNFNLLQQGRDMAKLISQMKAISTGLKLLGSVWSPPGWMKLNGVQEGTTVNNNLNPAYSGSYAEYFVQYIQRFAKMGVKVDAISIQNEPLNSAAGFPTMYVSADNATNLIENFVGPALRIAGLDTEIWAYDHNLDVPSYPQEVIDHDSQYVDTVAWHCYAANNTWSVMTDFHNTNPNVDQYMTECWLSPFTSWYQSIYFTMGPLQNWGRGVIAWVLGTNTDLGPHLPGGCNSCRGVVEIAPDGSSYTLTNDYYYLGQFSKFLHRGATVLASSGSYDYGSGAGITYQSSGSGVEAVATLNADGTRTVVVYNGFGNDVYLTVTFASGDVWSGPLYEYSITTWLLPAN